jgi:hypothetical protein
MGALLGHAVRASGDLYVAGVVYSDFLEKLNQAP